MLHKAFQFFVIICLATLTLSFTQAQTTLPLPGKSSIELLTNPGFEADTDANKIPDGWKAKNTTITKSDKIKCDKPDSTVAHSGNCAFMFRGNPNRTTSVLSQKLTDFSSLTDGATVTFSAYIDPRSAKPGTTFAKAKIVVSNNTKLKLKLVVPESDTYTQVSDSTVLNLAGKAIIKLQVKLLNDQSKGKFLIDDASLTVSEIVPTATPTSELTNTPVEATPTPTTEASATSTSTEQPSITPDLSTNTATFTATSSSTPTNTATWTATPTSTSIPNPVKLIASDSDPDTFFASAVAIDGDTIIVGRPYDNLNRGAIYVFVWNGSMWIEQQKLVASDPTPNDYFGEILAISGDTIVVGNYERNNYQGVVYVFTRNAGVWIEQQILVATDTLEPVRFGRSVAIDNDTLVVGAPNKKSETSDYDGVVYVFTDNDGIWTEQAILKPDPETDALFGWSTAISGDTVIVGGIMNAHVFTRNGETWSEPELFMVSDPDEFELYGISVDIEGDVIVVGVPAKGNFYEGGAYIIERIGNVWIEPEELIVSNFNNHKMVGQFVAISGQTIIVLSTRDVDELNVAHIFTYTDNSWLEQQTMDSSNFPLVPTALDFNRVVFNTWVYSLP